MRGELAYLDVYFSPVLIKKNTCKQNYFSFFYNYIFYL